MFWIYVIMITGCILFSLGQNRLDEKTRLGQQYVPDHFMNQLFIFMFIWPILLPFNYPGDRDDK